LRQLSKAAILSLKRGIAFAVFQKINRIVSEILVVLRVDFDMLAKS
jgi:hypothetical protein